MKLTKLKSRRGTTLAEVLIVVAIMAIMLGIAMPNLLSESQAIKLSAMNGYARSVAVAVQSRLYGMKNAGISSTSSYRLFNDTVATDETLTTDEGAKKVKYVSNFGEKGSEGKRYLFSGALTDTQLLQKGNIVVVYDPETADVLETFYSENPFNAGNLFPASTDAYLKSNTIGIYRGEGAPAPVTKTALPTPTLTMENGEELVAKIYIPNVDAKLYNQKVAIEVFIADKEGNRAMIYGEGFYNMNFTPVLNGQPCLYGVNADAPLLLGEIQGKTLKFAVDSIVLTGVPYQLVAEGGLNLLHSTSETSVFCEEYPMLFPRASLLNQWLLYGSNSHYAAWIERNPEITAETLPHPNVGDDITIEVVLHALTEEVSTDGRYRKFYDDDAEKLRKKSEEGFDLKAKSTGAIKVNGFFESAETREDGKTEVKISCVRHLQNLCFDGSMWNYHGITDQSDKYCAKLMKDIGGDKGSSWYELLLEIRAELSKKYDEYLLQHYGGRIADIYPEAQIRFGGAVRRLGGDVKFEFDGGGHKISGLCINAIAIAMVPATTSETNFWDFFGTESDGYRDFFTELQKNKDDSNWMVSNWDMLKAWFLEHAGDCFAVFPLNNCTLSDIQDDQTALYYVEADSTYVNP